uniref:All trans-polyprenyl-diphosphate synthase PDSS1 n=1 Tax=Hirondellea gigas TaxID=1518452 RepID=A0A6A7FTZ6_9CRUS
MARSVKSLGVNLLENVVYKRIFTVSRRSKCDVIISKESSGFLKGTSHSFQSSSRFGSAPTARLLGSQSSTTDITTRGVNSNSFSTSTSNDSNSSRNSSTNSTDRSSIDTQTVSASSSARGVSTISASLGSLGVSASQSAPITADLSAARGLSTVAAAAATGLSTVGIGSTSAISRLTSTVPPPGIGVSPHHSLWRPPCRGNASFGGGGVGGALVDSHQQHTSSSTAAAADALPRESDRRDATTDADAADATLSPHKLAEPDLLNLFIDIRKALKCPEVDLEDIACYYFDGQGKVIRPIITVLMARALNQHVSQHHRLLRNQLEIAKVTEMIHTASLLHDDVLDMADIRRGKPSVTLRFGQRKSVMAGDYILAVASTLLARINNPQVTIVLAQVLADLVQGEFMQLGSKENENERFSHYLDKTFKKTASLIAHSCQAVGILGGADEQLQQVCFQYGRNVGIAFQLVDDVLDFVASANSMGKPASVDLKLGIATAPVLFACEKFPELNAMILRRFSEPGDVTFAFECVHRSDGLQQTKLLARKHCLEAIRVLDALAHSQEKMALIAITDKVLNRIR